MQNRKKKWGDRWDGYRVRGLDPVHVMMPYIFGSRIENEAVLGEVFDLTEVDKYLAAKNAGNPDFKYTLFHVLLTAMAKTLYLRPKMNRFICNGNMYQRNEVSAAFHMPKGTDEEKVQRSAAIQEGLRACTEAPLGLMELCAECLTLVESMMGRCNDTCVSDLGAAAVSLKAGLMGAWLNVRVNIAWLKDKEFARACREKGEALLASALPVADRCYAGALERCE